MGKKVKGLVGKIKKFTEKFDPLGAGTLNQFVDPLVDQFAGTDFTGQKAEAARLAAEDAARQEAIRQQALNANVDLSNTNVADIQAGGTASDATAANRRRRGTGGVASSLGINA